MCKIKRHSHTYIHAQNSHITHSIIYSEDFRHVADSQRDSRDSKQSNHMNGLAGEWQQTILELDQICTFFAFSHIFVHFM